MDVKAMHPTKQQLIREGLRLLLKQGYSDVGIQALLAATGTPKGSFYHHFKDKEDFALQVVDAYMEEVHAGLDACLNDLDRSPVARVRHFFEMTEQKYREEGYLGCLLGGLGQELSGVSEVFRHKIEACLAAIVERVARCLEEAQRQGEIAASADPTQLANLWVNCWEGAALRSRLTRDPTSLHTMLDFYTSAITGRRTKLKSKQKNQGSVQNEA
jgi:TetR/AcrR family transcriptional regulator, transcriptional repressor for nem operon